MRRTSATAPKSIKSEGRASPTRSSWSGRISTPQALLSSGYCCSSRSEMVFISAWARSTLTPPGAWRPPDSYGCCGSHGPARPSEREPQLDAIDERRRRGTTPITVRSRPSTSGPSDHGRDPLRIGTARSASLRSTVCGASARSSSLVNPRPRLGESPRMGRKSAEARERSPRPARPRRSASAGRPGRWPCDRRPDSAPPNR